MGNLGGGLRSIDWSSQKLERFEKNFYAEDKRISALSEREVEEFRRSKDIKARMHVKALVWCFLINFFFQVQGRGVPRPVRAFDEAGFPEYILASIRAQGFTTPTPIQCQAWPMALNGRDVVAIAQTGSGKTISFALPAMLHINA